MRSWLTVITLCFAVIAYSDTAPHVPSLDSLDPNLTRKQKNKPPALLLYANKDKGFTKSRQAMETALSACNFDVRTLDLGAVPDFDKSLAELSLPDGTPVMVTASHGGEAKEGTAPTTFQEFAIDPKDGYRIAPEQIFSSLSRRLKNSPKLLDVCHAGICKDKASCMAMSCLASEPSHNTKDGLTNVEKSIVELLCDSIAQCTKIDSADSNDDRELNHEEITAYLIKKYGGRRQHHKDYYKAEIEEGVALHREDCNKLQGEFTSKKETTPSYLFDAEGPQYSKKIYIEGFKAAEFISKLVEGVPESERIMALEKKDSKALRSFNLKSTLQNLPREGYSTTTLRSITPVNGKKDFYRLEFQYPDKNEGQDYSQEWKIIAGREDKISWSSSCDWGPMVPVIPDDLQRGQTPIFQSDFKIRCQKK